MAEALCEACEAERTQSREVTGQRKEAGSLVGAALVCHANEVTCMVVGHGREVRNGRGCRHVWVAC